MVLCDALESAGNLHTTWLERNLKKCRESLSETLRAEKFTTTDVVTEKAEPSLSTIYEAGFVFIINMYIIHIM